MHLLQIKLKNKLNLNGSQNENFKHMEESTGILGMALHKFLGILQKKVLIFYILSLSEP